SNRFARCPSAIEKLRRACRASAGDRLGGNDSRPLRALPGGLLAASNCGPDDADAARGTERYPFRRRQRRRWARYPCLARRRRDRGHGLSGEPAFRGNRLLRIVRAAARHALPFSTQRIKLPICTARLSTIL